MRATKLSALQQTEKPARTRTRRPRYNDDEEDSGVTLNDKALRQLMDMGFAPQRAVQALVQCNQSLDDALQHLLEGTAPMANLQALWAPVPHSTAAADRAPSVPGNTKGSSPQVRQAQNPGPPSATRLAAAALPVPETKHMSPPAAYPIHRPTAAPATQPPAPSLPGRPPLQPVLTPLQPTVPEPRAMAGFPSALPAQAPAPSDNLSAEAAIVDSPAPKPRPAVVIIKHTRNTRQARSAAHCP